MAQGGKRPGAGRKVGAKSKSTLAKAQVEEAYRAFMLQEQAALWRAQRERAIGVYVLVVKTEDGYQRVTDPDMIEKIIAKPQKRGQSHWLIEAQAADVPLAKEINNRLMGLPTQQVEMGTADGAPMPVRIVYQELKG